jgi:hypothetical protein
MMNTRMFVLATSATLLAAGIGMAPAAEVRGGR